MKSRFSPLMYFCAVLAITGSVFYGQVAGDVNNITCTPDATSASVLSGTFKDNLSVPTGTAVTDPLVNTGTSSVDRTFTVDCYDTTILRPPHFSSSVTITVLPEPPTATLSARPTSVNRGGSSTLTWNTVRVPNNAVSCAGTGFSTGGAPSGSVSVGPLTTTTTYSVTCQNGGGVSAPVLATVTVNQAPTASCYASAPGQDGGLLHDQLITIDLKNNQTVTWTATVSGGAAPYTYAWAGDYPLAGDPNNPHTGSTALVSYTSIGPKQGYITVTDSSNPPKSVDSQQCTNAVKVIDTTACGVSCPAAGDYALNANPTANMNFVGQTALSDPIPIYVIANDFTANIALSAYPDKFGGVDVSYDFYDKQKYDQGLKEKLATDPTTKLPIMTSQQYVTGVDMVIKATKTIAKGSYNLTLTGASTKSHTAPVILNVHVIRPQFQEF